MKYVIFSIFLGAMLIMSGSNVADALSTSKTTNVDLAILIQAEYNKDVLNANKKFENSIVKAQTIFDKAKSIAKKVYAKNIMKADGDYFKTDKADKNYQSMISKAKVKYDQSSLEAKRVYYDEIQQIKYKYS